MNRTRDEPAGTRAAIAGDEAAIENLKVQLTYYTLTAPISGKVGTFTLKAGQMVEQDIAPSWRDLDEAGKAKWKAFAYQVKGWEPETEDEEV